jgi:hypothetical protein
MFPVLRIFNQADQGGQPGRSGETTLTGQQLPSPNSCDLFAPIPPGEGKCQHVLFGSPDDQTHISSCSTGTIEEELLIEEIVGESFDESAEPAESQQQQLSQEGGDTK